MNRNIKFEFIYRDSEDERYGTVVFPNAGRMSLAAVKLIIYESLIGDLYFYPDNLALPNIRGEYDPQMDIDWYEFDGCRETKEKPTDERDIQEFLVALKRHKEVL